MVTGGLGLAERRSRIGAALDALTGLGDVLVEAGGAELADVMRLLDVLASRAGAARVAVALEAVRRGETGSTGGGAHEWVREHAPSLRQGGAGHVAALALVAAGGRGGSLTAEAPSLDPDSAEGMVCAGVIEGSVAPALGMAVLAEVDRLRPLLVEEAVSTVARALVDLGVQWGPGVMRRLRPRLLADHGRVGVFDDLQERLASAARLSAPCVASGDLTEYQLVMTPEQAAALEAAIGPLSAPAPNPETRERDLRPSGQRRVEALAEVCRRSSGLDAERAGADGAGGASAALHVTIALGDLEARTGSGEVLGSRATGTALSPEVLRRVACAADLIPHVLGTSGELLDLGRVVRLFTRAQRRRLWRRDGGCTYPACTAPAAWTRAHHVLHWADGGASDIDNAALLCERHHQVVHRRRLLARVRRRPDDRGRYVVWDLSDGSYDAHLERVRRERTALDPPRLDAARLAELVAALHGDDEIEHRWAEHELARFEEPDGLRADDVRPAA